MKRLLWLAVLLVLATTPIIAQQASSGERRPPTAEQVMRFFELMHVRTQTQALLQNEEKQIGVMLNDMLKKQAPEVTPIQRADFEKILHATLTDFFANYPIDDLLRDMVPVYQSHLTESDLTQVVTFYSSPVGQKMINEMPAMTAEAMRVSYARMQPQLQEMIKNLQTRLEELSQRDNGSTARTKPSDPAPSN